MRSWAEGSEVIRTGPRKPDSLLGRFRRWWSKRDSAQAGISSHALIETFKIGDRVRINNADPQFIYRIGAEATIASELERAADGLMYYRLDNNMSARPECLTLLERGAELKQR
jgi:hypothetical protein